MSYLVLARKYRPQIFSDVIGQSEITDKLKIAIASGRTAHAYLFCGPRGVGKTTCARILAKELNKTVAPDQASLDLGLQIALDIIEIDGASNTGVDDIRTLRDNAQLMPMGGGIKVYIIDEVHMLSLGAFNALLKTLEEPPPHVKFVFATTAPDKLPLTVISRCQRFDFRRIPLEQMAAHLKVICQKEHFTAEEDALFAIAKASQGSLRDALSVLDQLSSTSSGRIDIAEVNAMLGYVETQQLFILAEALLRKDCPAALKALEVIVNEGKDIKQLSKDLITFFRNLMVMKAGGQDLQDLIDYSAVYKKMLYELVSLVTMNDILFIIDRLVDAQDMARIIEMPQLALEITMARITSSGQPASVQPVPVKPMPSKSSPAQGMVLNNRGEISIEPIPFDRPPEPMSNGSLENILKDWNKLTHAVCQQSMSVGHYLLEGRPLKLNGRKLTIAFSPDNEFLKEVLEDIVNIKIIAAAIREVFDLDLAIELVLTDEKETAVTGTAVNDALAMFGGEVVNEWDNDNGLS